MTALSSTVMEWSDLRFFLAVHREGTLSGAARATGVAQTTVGRRIEALEAELNAKLFRRTKQGFQITEVGEAILDAAEGMEAKAAAIQRRAAGDQDRVGGLIRIATTEAFARTHVVPRIAPLLHAHPELRIQILTGNQAADLERDADLAVRLMRPNTPALIGRKVAEIDLALFASQDYLDRHGRPEIADGFAGHRVVGYLKELASAPEARWLSDNAARAAVPLATNSIPGLVRAVAEGVALGIAPRELAVEHALVEVLSLDALPPRPVWLVFPADLQSDARIRAVVECFVGEA